MPTPLISVVIPFLDPPAEFFREAVHSVAAQDYEALELLLVNDGSDTPSVELAKSLARQIDRPAAVIQHADGRNHGLSATRNHGARAAKGDLLAFLDADDVWAPEKLREQAEVLRENSRVAMVFGPTRYWFRWHAAATEDDFIVDRGIDRVTELPPPSFVTQFLRGRIIVPSASNTLIRRDAYLDCGGFEESFRDVYEDQAFLIKLGLRHSVIAVPKCWDRYRQHPGSMMARANAAGEEDHARRAFLAWVRRYLLERGIDAPEVWEAVNKEMWLAEKRRETSGAIGTRIRNRLRSLWLRTEEAMLPARVRHRFWGRP